MRRLWRWIILPALLQGNARRWAPLDPSVHRSITDFFFFHLFSQKKLVIEYIHSDFYLAENSSCVFINIQISSLWVPREDFPRIFSGPHLTGFFASIPGKSATEWRTGSLHPLRRKRGQKHTSLHNQICKKGQPVPRRRIFRSSHTHNSVPLVFLRGENWKFSKRASPYFFPVNIFWTPSSWKQL